MSTQQVQQDAYNLGVLIGQLSRQRGAYQWRATYTDGAYTDECDDARPDGRGWAEREERPVRTITLMQEGREVESMTIPDNAEPIFFRRRTIELRLDDEQATARPAIHCIGWKQDEQAVYLFVMPDGSTLLTDDLQAV